MNTLTIFTVFFALAAVVIVNNTSALPLTEDGVQDAAVHVAALDAVEHAVASVEEHSRQKRATCDLLSKFNVNHSACAAHCLLKGFKGGYCNGMQVCVCRR